MKKVYTKPVIEIEAYTLSESIALNCGNVISLGPGLQPDHSDACDEFKGSWEVAMTTAADTNTSFYETGTVCDCYYSSGGQGYFTS